MTLYNDHSLMLPCGYTEAAWKQYFQDQIAAWQEDDEEEECFAVVVIQMEDEPIHTDEHPFCDDVNGCPCHRDTERFWQYCDTPYQEGLITKEEQARIFYGEQIA